MKEKEVREPIQKRSKEKKRKIIEAGFKLFSENGYHNTNTIEIASEAGISTGAVYNYFKDKKSIFLETICLYTELLTKPMLEYISTLAPPIDLESVIESMLDAFIAGHNMAKNAHEEMIAMSHSDAEVSELFHNFDAQIAEKLVVVMMGLGFQSTNLLEKIHIAKGLLENYCHEVVYYKHEQMDYNIMRKIVIKQVVSLWEIDL